MPELSVAIITRDEEDRIEEAIASVRGLATEILVMDSGSTDRTVERAAAAGARVIETDWPGHVAQKNRALDACRAEWVLSIDADERVDADLAASVRRVLAEPGGAVGFEVRRLSYWMGAPIRHGAWYPDRRVRLVRRDRARWQGLNPHDHLVADGSVGRLDGHLLHHPYRSLGEHLAVIDRYTAIASRSLAEAGVKAGLLDVLLRPFLHFVKVFLLKGGFRDGVRGVVLAWLGATYVALKWGRRWLGDPAVGP